MGKLDGRVALVTGGASGIGKAQAVLFAQHGATVVVADRDESGARVTAGVIEVAGGNALGVAMDVTDDDSVTAAVSAAMSSYGRIDILSNTAGMFDHFAQTLDTDRKLWDAMLAVNLTGIYTVTNAVLPHMITAGKGAIINIASGAGLRGGGGGAAYTSTKHAVVGYTRQLSAGYGKQGIRVNAIAPGLIDTPMVASFSKDEETLTGLRQQPAGRLGKPEDIANAALFLVSDDADFIHAITLPVDGGLVETL
ncbi:3-oxoacyl-[acyl-carrier protein] reductase [Rhodococcus wratislaviensis]|uniref:3-oxoacyl-[acyl-carrier protein] reductase n=1 Tax=Rhodococcus wratislaviensis TaxID=44752 RepID=A0A402CN74_RHOWR|nr:glucose 1-dehydrogenase [Rhodococcus wratislaviensis]GCE45031.1 3-oxoacyl-[acyl-carrier protein] reductase [Rhodococcus wratislaviensis]